MLFYKLKNYYETFLAEYIGNEWSQIEMVNNCGNYLSITSSPFNDKILQKFLYINSEELFLISQLEKLKVV